MNTPEFSIFKSAAHAGRITLAGTACLVCSALSLSAEVVNTNGSGTNLVSPFTWEGMFVPQSIDTANFAHPGKYTILDGGVFEVEGITINSDGVEFVDTGPLVGTINLGSGGISGNNDLVRIGDGVTSMFLNVVADQTWSLPITNGIKAAIGGTATITHTSASRLWLRGGNYGFTGIWRSDGGFIHPDANPQWSGAAGALGQVLNGGAIRLSNSVYDRVRIEAVGDGFLRVSGASSNNGSFATMTPGGGEGTGNIFGAGNLTLDSHLSYGKLVLNGNVAHQGDTIIADEPEGMHLELSSASTYTAYIGTGGVSNGISGQSADTSHLLANGTFIFDFIGSGYSGGTWTIVDKANLDATFGTEFSVQGFTPAGDGVTWTRADGAETWTFDETTGVLTRSGEGGGATSIFAEDPLVAGGWRDTPIGLLVDEAYPYVYHLQAGWLYLDPETSVRASIYGYGLAEGFWFWTSVSTAGWHYDLAADAWAAWAL